MKTLYISFLALLAAVIPLQAFAADIDEAHRAFAEGRFHDSTQGYEAVLAERGYSAPVLFDLGNSLFREGKVSAAILAYKRAQLLAPADPDIAANLEIAQKQAGVAAYEPQWSDKITGFLSASGWAWLGCAAWTLFCAALLARRILPRQRSLLSFVSTAAAIVLLASVAAIVVTSGSLKQAIVLDKNANALISPFPAAQTVFTPAPGETVTVQKAYNDFLLVTDPTGHSGWMSKAQVTPVVQDHPVE